MNLCDKYAPTRSTEMLGDLSVIRDISVWLANRKIRRQDKEPCLMLSGPPGVGTTTAAQLCLREVGYEVLENNASHLRTGKEMKHQLSLLRSVTHSMFGDKPKALLIDEVDALYANDSGAGDELTKYIAAAQTSKKWMAPIICTSRQHKHGKMLDLAKKAHVICLPPIPDIQLQTLAKKVQQDEGLRLRQEDLTQLVHQVRGDVRQLLIQLQMASSSQARTAGTSCNDVHIDVTTAINRLLQGDKPCTTPEALRMFNTDVSIIPLMVYENYLDMASARKCDIDVVARCADSISASGVMEEQMYSQQAWELYDNYGILSSVLPSFKCCSKGKKTLRFGTLWSKISNTCTKKKSFRRINSRICIRTSPDLLTIGMLRDMAYKLVLDQNWKDLDHLCCEYHLNLADLALVMKHSSMSPIKASYRATVHARVKKGVLPYQSSRRD